MRLELAEKEKKRTLVMYVLAGHGIVGGNRQSVLLNQYEPATKFYKYLPIEFIIRDNARKF